MNKKHKDWISVFKQGLINNNTSMVLDALKQGVDPKQTFWKAKTVLGYAFYHDNEEILDALLNFGVTPTNQGNAEYFRKDIQQYNYAEGYFKILPLYPSSYVFSDVEKKCLMQMACSNDHVKLLEELGGRGWLRDPGFDYSLVFPYVVTPQALQVWINYGLKDIDYNALGTKLMQPLFDLFHPVIKQQYAKVLSVYVDEFDFPASFWKKFLQCPNDVVFLELQNSSAWNLSFPWERYSTYWDALRDPKNQIFWKQQENPAWMAFMENVELEQSTALASTFSKRMRL